MDGQWVSVITVESAPGEVSVKFDDIGFLFSVPDAKEFASAVMRKAFEAEGHADAD